jgi:hypothetical protein
MTLIVGSSVSVAHQIDATTGEALQEIACSCLLVSLDAQTRKAGDTRPMDRPNRSRRYCSVSCVVDAAPVRFVNNALAPSMVWALEVSAGTGVVPSPGELLVEGFLRPG